MTNKVSAEQRQFIMKIIKEAGKVLIILIAAVMAFKFISWNFWKIKQAVDIAGEIRTEPPAVNLAIWEKNSPVYRKSFAHNEKGNYYINNHFDISDYISDAAAIKTGNLKITVNNREITSFWLYRYKQYNVLYTGEYYFAFMVAGSGIEVLDRLDKSFVEVALALPLLYLKGWHEGQFLGVEYFAK